MRYLLPILISFTLSQESIKVCTYNILNFSGSTEDRVQYFQEILPEMGVDILVVQEIINNSGVQLFLNDVLNQSDDIYSAAPFINGPDTDNMLYYREPVQLISTEVIYTSLRDINGYTVTSGSDTITIYSLHLKASQGSSNEQRRLEEVQSLNENMSASHPFIVAGDYNIYNSSEPAFQYLINDMNLSDPINEIGGWHDNESFAEIHSQSTRSGDIGDGGASGGMDDRFDMILLSEEIEYVEESYYAFGNDGIHFNQSINYGTNIVVSEEIADALHFATDHLPVCAEFQFSNVIQGDINEDGQTDILDIVLIVDMILGNTEEIETADLNQDGLIDVLDIILLVNLILG